MPVFDADTGKYWRISISESKCGGGFPADLESALDDLDKGCDYLFAQNATKKKNWSLKDWKPVKRVWKIWKVKDLQILVVEGYAKKLVEIMFPLKLKENSRGKWITIIMV